MVSPSGLLCLSALRGEERGGEAVRRPVAWTASRQPLRCVSTGVEKGRVRGICLSCPKRRNRGRALRLFFWPFVLF